MISLWLHSVFDMTNLILLFGIKTLPWLGKTLSPRRKRPWIPSSLMSCTRRNHCYINFDSTFDLFPRRMMPWNSSDGSTRPSQRILACGGPKLQTQVSPVLLHVCPLRSYATPDDMMGEQVPLCIRPWQLPYRRDFGLRGTCDNDPTLVVPII